MNPLKLSPFARPAALFGAGVVLSAFLAGLILIVWKGGWVPTLQPEQLKAVSLIAYGVLFLLAVVLIALASVNAKVQGPGGFSASIDGDGDGKNETGG